MRGCLGQLAAGPKGQTIVVPHSGPWSCPPYPAATYPTVPHPQPPKCLEPPSHPEEPSDLEELEQFARTFKQRRIKLGFTQVGSEWDQQVGVGVVSCGCGLPVWISGRT